jgi:hypothetical protein
MVCHTAMLAVPRSDKPRCSHGRHDERCPARLHGGGVWKSTSHHVEVKSVAFFSGSSAYAQDRWAMTPTPLSALEGLIAIDTTDGSDGRRRRDGASWGLLPTDDAHLLSARP